MVVVKSKVVVVSHPLVGSRKASERLSDCMVMYDRKLIYTQQISMQTDVSVSFI